MSHLAIRFKRLVALFVLLAGLLLSIGSTAFAQGNPPPNENLDSPGFTFNVSSITFEGIDGSVRQQWIRGGVDYFFGRAVSLLASLIGTAAVLMMSVGGFLMLSSAGNESQYEKGKNFVKFSLIGLAVALSAYILVTLVQLLVVSLYA